VTKWLSWLAEPGHRLPLILGMSDGLLNALLLTGHSLLRNQTVTMTLALRVSGFAAVSGAFAFGVARQAEARLDLIEQGRQLNLVRGRAPGLAGTDLGRRARQTVAAQAVIVTTFGFIGAFVPMATAVKSPVLAVAVALGVLAGVGVVIGRATASSAPRWAAALVVGGAAMSVIGIALHLT
jgi:hypothetical protein